MVTSPTPVVLTPGGTVAVAVRAEATDGTPLASVVPTVAAVPSGGVALEGATATAVTLRGVGVTVDTITLRAAQGGVSVEVPLPVVVRPAGSVRLVSADGDSVVVDSAETRAGYLRLLAADGTPVPLAPTPRGLGFGAEAGVTLVPAAGAVGTWSVTGAAVAPRVVRTLRLGPDSLAAVAVRVTPVWGWLSVTSWIRGAGRAMRFVGIAARDSLVYEGPADGSAPPVRVPGLPRMQRVAGGEATVCALTLDGTMWCAGSNLSGQLGRPDEPAGTSALDQPWGPVATTERFVAVTVYGSGARALTADGRWFGWGYAPAGVRPLGWPAPTGCGQGRTGVCAPLALLPTRRFDTLAPGAGHCAREVGTGAWWCGGALARLQRGTNVMEIGPADTLWRLDLGRFGPVTAVQLTINGSSAVGPGGEALNWEPFVANQARAAAGQPPVGDTLILAPGTRWRVAPLVNVGVRADGVLLAWRNGQQNLLATPFVLDPAPILEGPEVVWAAMGCVRTVVGQVARCIDLDVRLAQPVVRPIPRPGR